MRVQRIFNTALVNERLTADGLWDRIAEDNVPSREEFTLDPEEMMVIALIGDDDALHGFVISHPVTFSVMSTHVAISTEYWGHKDNVELGKMAVELIFQLTDAIKQTACIPVTDKEVLRYAQRVGFEREGINKASFIRGGETLDQYYVGFRKQE